MREAAFFSNEEELFVLRQRSVDKNAAERVYVALTPAADFAASQHAVPYVTIEDLYEEADLSSATNETFETVVTLCNLLDAQVAIEGERPGQFAFSLGQYFFALKSLHDGVFRCGLAASDAFETLKPVRIVVFSTELETSHSGVELNPDVMMHALVTVANEKGVGVEILEPPVIGHGEDRGAVGRMFTIGARFINQFRKLAAVRTFMPPTKGPLQGIRILQNRHWCDASAQHLRDRGVVIRIASRVLKYRKHTANTDASVWIEKGRTAWNSIRGNEEVRSIFGVKGIDFFALVEPHLEFALCEMMPFHMQRYCRARDVIRAGNYDLMLGCAPISVDVVSVHAAAQAEGVPTVGVQHGGYYGYAEFPMMHFTESYMEDEFLSWGEGVNETVNNFSAPEKDTNVRTQPNLRAVGSVMLANLHARVKPQTPNTGKNLRVLYVPTQMTAHYRHLSHILYPDILYSRLQRQILDICVKGGVDLVVKVPLHLSEDTNILRTICAQGGHENCVINTQTPLVDHLASGEFDLVILDTPTTVLLQALTTKTPVVVLFPRTIMRPLDDALSLLQRRAHVGLSYEEHVEIVTQLIGGDLMPGEGVDVEDETFLRHYGLGDNENTPATRLESAVSRIASHNVERPT